MPKNIKKGAFFSADLTITAGTTYSTTTPLVRCENVEEIQVAVKATGKNASSAGAVTVVFQAAIGGEYWNSGEWQNISVTVAGTASKQSPPEILNVKGLSAIRVASITNGDGSYDIDGVNVLYGFGIA